MKNESQRKVSEDAEKELRACLDELRKDAELFDLNGAEYVQDFNNPTTYKGKRYHTHAIIVHMSC